MKKITFVLFALISGTTFAQSASANAAAEIVTPMTITKVTDLNFGKVVSDAAADKVLVLDNDGTVNATTDVTYISTSSRTAATFTITGTAGKLFSVTIPTTAITLDGALTVSDLTMNLNTANNTVEADGANDLSIGGTLNVPTGKADGDYTATINVSVAYE